LASPKGWRSWAATAQQTRPDDDNARVLEQPAAGWISVFALAGAPGWLFVKGVCPRRGSCGGMHVEGVHRGATSLKHR
jgi:hypothetical protein